MFVLKIVPILRICEDNYGYVVICTIKIIYWLLSKVSQYTLEVTIFSLLPLYSETLYPLEKCFHPTHIQTIIQYHSNAPNLSFRAANRRTEIFTSTPFRKLSFDSSSKLIIS